MRSKKGFAFVETIITVVILSASLLYLYSTYNAIISDEKVRLYYDDPAFIYYTNYVRKFLEEYSDIENVKKNYFNDTYVVTLGTGFDALFNETEKADNRINSLEEIVKSFKINQMILVKSEMFDNCYEGTEKYCKSSINNLSYNMQKYVNSLSDTKYDYYLVIEYANKLEDPTEENKNKERDIIKCTPGMDKRCQTYYASVGMYGKAQEKSKTLSEYVISQYNGVQGTNNIYYHNGTLENGINDRSYRFSGSSTDVNNFVCFGSNQVPCPDDNLYRIIGVFNDRVKLIKADYATSELLGTNGDYKYAFSAPSFSSSYKGKLTTINTYTWNKATKYNTWSTSLLNKTNLNQNFITNIKEEWANKIDMTTWKVGGNTENNIYSQPAKTVYQNEVVNPVLGAHSSETEYSAKIGLMYVSDYGFAAAPSAWTTVLNKYETNGIPNTNWMYLGAGEWTISRNANSLAFAFYVDKPGALSNIGNIEASNGAVRPVFNLEASTSYVSGNGTKSDPIIIK